MSLTCEILRREEREDYRKERLNGEKEGESREGEAETMGDVEKMRQSTIDRQVHDMEKAKERSSYRMY